MELTHSSRRTAVLLAAAITTAGCTQGSAPTQSPAPTAPRTSDAPARTPSSSTSSTTGKHESSSTTSSKDKTSTTATGRPKVTAGESGSPRADQPDPESVNERNAAAVANAYARTAYTFDTSIDASANDAQRRAARWLTEDLADSLEEDLPATTGWDRLKKQGAWAEVTVTDVTPDGSDPRNGTTTSRLQQVKITTRDKDGKRIGSHQTLTLDLSLTRDDPNDPWRIRDIQTY
ncbi:hypothetical protein [Janibacter corallicola]|uniref:hypothetical protein n=1 Tax=Janibacter corallicola TaxID=415212 RepID=UPI00082A2935|nr:hypothetical protein [Janibacter corallicola]